MADLTLLNKTDVVDDLTSSDTNKPLSANQGKELNDNKQDKLPSVVNDRYLHTNSSTGALEWAEVSDDYLKLDGTTAMTGSLKVKSGLNSITTMAENDALTICGGQDTFSPSLSLYGRNRSSSAGQFSLIAKDTSSEKDLIGKPDGTLTWDGNNIVTETSGDSRYLKLSGGTMTGQVVIDQTIPLRRNSDADYIKIGCSTSDNLAGSPSVRVYGASHASYPGTSMLEANDGTNQRLLIAKPDESLLWANNYVLYAKRYNYTAIEGITNGSINTANTYAIKLCPGFYYVSMLLSGVTLNSGETKIATTFKVNGEKISSINTLCGNYGGSGTFYPASGVAWSGGLWITTHNGGTGELRLGGVLKV